MFAGTRKSDGLGEGVELTAGWNIWFADTADPGLFSSLLKRAVSKRVSPGACVGSVKGAGTRCKTPNPRTQPIAPSPPQLRDGVIVTVRVTSYSWL